MATLSEDFAIGKTFSSDASRSVLDNVAPYCGLFLVSTEFQSVFQLRFENRVLFLDVRNHVELMPVDPARQGYEKKLPRLNSIHVSYFTDKDAGS